MRQMYRRLVLCSFLVTISIMGTFLGCGGGSGAATFTIGGTVTGLSGTLVIQNSDAQQLTLLGTGSGSFTFDTPLADGATYLVSALTQPTGQTCTINNPSGTISGANITNIEIACANITYTIGGTVTGLTGTLLLQNTDNQEATVTGDGAFTFANGLADGSNYAVTVKSDPTGQGCFVTNGSGMIAGANRADIEVSCHTSGAIDTSFNTTGYNYCNGVAAVGSGNAITTDANGRILVTGYLSPGGIKHMITCRFTADGALDATFNSSLGGFVVDGDFTNDVEGFGITTDSSGNILVTGSWAGTTPAINMMVWRYTDAGEIDTTFSTDGKVSYMPLLGTGAYGRGIVLDANGNILIGGTTMGTENDMTIWRYTSTGTLDTTFNSGGIEPGVVNYNAGGNNSAYAIAIDGNGLILTAGYAAPISTDNIAVWRYNTTGDIDTTFGNSGIATYQPASVATVGAQSLDIDSSNRPVVTGSLLEVAFNMFIARFTTTGALDTTFNPGGTGSGVPGLVIHPNDLLPSRGNGIAIDGRGRILATGYITLLGGVNTAMATWRYTSDGDLDTNFNTGAVLPAIPGMVVYEVISPWNALGSGITLDSIGRILVTGNAYSGSRQPLTVWRYLP